MNPEEAAIVTEIAETMRSLNSILERAQFAGLEVKIDYTSLEEIGKRGSRRIYFAEVSKLAFSQRVG